MAVISQRCYKCREEKKPDEFYKNRSRKSGLQGTCKECHKDIDRIRYQNNPAPKNRRNAAARAIIRALIINLKDKACADCSVKYPHWAMQFDHVRGVKKFTIGEAAGRIQSKAAIIAEAEKCDIVCANCHLGRSYFRRKKDLK